MRALVLSTLGLLGLVAAACSRSHAAPASDPALFEPIASVLIHPRCINCHQEDSPRQTDAKILHQPLVVRGADGHGAPTQPCQTCHQTMNTAGGFVPGAAGWSLAPLSMVWEGRTKSQICEQVKDPARNGGRHAGEEIIEHMKTDPMVLWAWSPGAGRTTPPIAHAKFIETLETWVRAGMPCPMTRTMKREVQHHQPGHEVFKTVLPEDTDWMPFPAAGGVGHNLPQETPAAFAKAVIDVHGYFR